MAITNGLGQVNVRKDRDPPHLGPRHQVKVALDLRCHCRKDSERPVKVPRVCVPRLHPTQEIGGRDGDRLPVMVIDRRQLSRRMRHHRDAGCRISVATCVGNSAVIASFMNRMLCRHKCTFRSTLFCVWPVGMPLIPPPGWSSAAGT